MVKISDYVISFLEEKGLKHIFMLPGGGAMHLNDSLAKSKKINYTCNLNEQSVSIAAEAYSKYSEKFGCAMVTSGPGATNTITGVNSCWADSTPVLFLSGQVKRKDLIKNTGLRMGGYQESNIEELVKPITKYSKTIEKPEEVRYHLEKAYYLMVKGRPGPVWLDFPLDIQSQEIEETSLKGFDEKKEGLEKKLSLNDSKIEKTLELLKNSKRPVMIAGNGIRLSKGMNEFYSFLEKTQIPLLTTWGAIDFVEEDYPQYFGRPNILGANRAASFVMQNSDVLLTVGARLGVQTVGYLNEAFAREAKHIMVDVDEKELNKEFLSPYLKINSDARDFLNKINSKIEENFEEKTSWLNWCKERKEKYFPGDFSPSKEKGKLNQYLFLSELFNQLEEGDIISPSSSGSSYVCSSQIMKMKKGQRFLTSRGMASMGWDLPSSIGACIAGERKRTICVTGDGSIQMNLQELETIRANNLPIKIFVFDNGGYLTIKNTQKKYFGGNLIGCDKSSSLNLPNLERISEAYGIPSTRISEDSEISEEIKKTLNREGPSLCRILTNPNQEVVPKVVAKLDAKGKMIPMPIEDLYPFLEEKELKENMIIDTWEEFKNKRTRQK